MALYGSQSRRIVVVDVYSDGDSTLPQKSSQKSSNSSHHPVQNGISHSGSDYDEHNAGVNGRSSPTPNLIPSSTDDFVTVVQVDEARSSPSTQEINFVTVLQVGDDECPRRRHPSEGEIVTIYRLPGERLGMALKFEGGMNANENISRVFIQSINPGSPASRAKTSTGPLQEGDEIIKIDGRHVSSMTRLDCVSLLRDAPVCITMLICHNRQENQTNGHDNNDKNNSDGESRRSFIPKRKKGPPPPIPPRKTPSLSGSDSSSGEDSPVSVKEKIQMIEKHSVSPERPACKRPSHPPPLPPQRRKETAPSPLPQPEDGEISPKDKSPIPGSSVSMRLPGWEELMMRRAANKGEERNHGDQLPVEPHVYMDLIAEEAEKHYIESESDDTGSSVSTVIERFSRASTANSSFSEHTHQSLDRPQPFDLEKVLSPFEQLERELDGESPEDLPLDDTGKTLEHDERDTELIMEGEGESSIGITVVEPLEAELLAIDPPESFQDGVPVSSSSDTSSELPENCKEMADNNSSSSDSSLENIDVVSSPSPDNANEQSKKNINGQTETEATFNVVITSNSGNTSSSPSISTSSSDGGCESDGSSSSSSSPEPQETPTESKLSHSPRPPPIPPRRGKIPLPIIPATSSPDRPYMNRELRKNGVTESSRTVIQESGKKVLVSRMQTVTKMEVVESSTSITKFVKRKDGSMSAINVSKKHDVRQASRETKTLSEDGQAIVKMEHAKMAYAEVSASIVCQKSEEANVSADEVSLLSKVDDIMAIDNQETNAEDAPKTEKEDIKSFEEDSEIVCDSEILEIKSQQETKVQKQDEPNNDERIVEGKDLPKEMQEPEGNTCGSASPIEDNITEHFPETTDFVCLATPRNDLPIPGRHLEDIKEVDEEIQDHQSDGESSSCSLETESSVVSSSSDEPLVEKSRPNIEDPLNLQEKFEGRKTSGTSSEQTQSKHANEAKEEHGPADDQMPQEQSQPIQHDGSNENRESIVETPAIPEDQRGWKKEINGFVLSTPHSSSSYQPEANKTGTETLFSESVSEPVPVKEPDKVEDSDEEESEVRVEPELEKEESDVGETTPSAVEQETTPEETIPEAEISKCSVPDDGNFTIQPGNEETLQDSAMDKMNSTSFQENSSLVEDIPPPPFTRQPPDGHEFPHNCVDPVDVKRDDFKSVISKTGDCPTGSPTGLEDSGVFLDDTAPGQWKSANSDASSPTTVLLADIPQDDFRKTYAALGNESVTPVTDTALLNACCNMRDNRELLRDFDVDSSGRSDIGTSSCSDSMDELDSTPFAKMKEPPVPPPRPSVPPRTTTYQENKMQNSHSSLETQGARQSSIVKGNLKPASYTLEKTTATLTKDIELGGMTEVDFQKSVHKWKSEENLRIPLTRYKGRENQPPLSVKERIAMFSRMDSDSSVVTRNTESKKVDDARLKHAYSSDMLVDREMTCDAKRSSAASDSFSRNSQKALPPTSDSGSDASKPQFQKGSSSSPTGTLQLSAASGLSKSTSNVSTLTQSKQPRENEFRPDIPASLTKPLSLLTDFGDSRRDYPMVSAYPQTQLSQSYKRYSSPALTYSGSLVSDDPLKRGNSSGSLLSILETRKEKATKLKGLIIPDRPNASSSIRQTLPTIASYTPIVLPKSETPVSSHALQLVKPDLSQPCRVSQSLPRGFDFKAVTNAQKDENTARQPVLSEPPWKSTKANLPKYSPAFKRRTFELPRSTVSSSVSPTPPSSLTSPLSPPPSSPSSICSSTASSSTGAKSPTPSKHNIFQFSLSHSKPVTPLLPEKAIISPPPCSSSDAEDSIRKTTENDRSPPPLPRQPPPSDSPSSSTNKLPPVPARPQLEKHLSADALTQSYGSQAVSTRSESTGSLWSLSSSSTVEHPKLTTSYSDTRYSKTLSNGNHAKESPYNSYPSRDRLSPSKDGNSNRSDPLNRLESLLTPNDAGSRNGPSESENTYHNAFASSGNAANANGYPGEDFRSRRDACNSKDTSYNGVCGQVDQANAQKNAESRRNDFTTQNSRNGQWAENGQTYYRKDTPGELESDEDTNSSLSSQNTEGSKHNPDDSSSDATSDSLERALSPEFRPRAISQQKTVLRNNADSTDSVKNFRALAEKWQQRATDNPRDVKSPPVPLSASVVRKDSPAQVVSGNNVRLPPSLFPRQQEQNPIPERKNSAPQPPSPVTSTSAVRMRESRWTTPPRPTSLIETRDKPKLDTMWDSNYFRRNASIKEFSEVADSKDYRRSNSENIRTDALDRMKYRQSSISSSRQNSRSVSDIRKAFEQQDAYQNGSLSKSPHVRKLSEDRTNLWSSKEALNSSGSKVPDHVRMSSLDSTMSEPDMNNVPSRYNSVSSLVTTPTEQYGSVTSLASTTSLISTQELQQLIDEANQSLEEAGTPTHEIHVVILHRETASGSIGITLAGGADYEVKEITVHKVITGSIADRDGRIRKGDRIISINGRNLKGVSHKEALEILKAPRPEVVLVLSRERSEPFSPSELATSREGAKLSELGYTSHGSGDAHFENSGSMSQTNCICVQLIKDGTGLGFIIEGGKESPLGDRPLTVKRIFKGGAADRDGTLLPGDEIVSVNSQTVLHMTRTEAWNFMKKLPNGPVVIIVKRKT